MQNRIRIIPVLLLMNDGLVKTKKFSKPVYIGDPINTVKLFNDKDVDELIILDINASREKRPPKLNQISKIVSEAFMPVAYGGGISSINQVKDLLNVGIEKVIFNYHAVYNLNLINNVSKIFGSQSVIVSIDIKKNFFGKYHVYTLNGLKRVTAPPIEFAKSAAEAGAGEIFLNYVNHDGTYLGYDLQLIKIICDSVNVPVIACGGAGNLTDFSMAINAGASAVAAGSYFIFKKPHNAVLISYPTPLELESSFYSLLQKGNKDIY